MQRVTQVLMVLVLCTVFVAGAFAGGAREVAPGPMVWVGWSGSEGASVPVFAEKIDRWNQGNPDNQVEWLGWPWSDALQQIIIRSQGGERMDIAQLQLGWAEVVGSMGVLADLDEVIGRDWLEANIPQAALDAGVINGRQLAVPYTSASIGMIYNPALLSAAGVDSPPETLAEFEDALVALKAYDPDMIPYGLTTADAGSVAQDLNAWFWTFGGRIIDDNGRVVLDSPENVAAVRWLMSLEERGLITLDMSRFDARVLFADRQIAFYDDAILGRAIGFGNGIPEAEWESHIMPMMRPTREAGQAPQSVLWGHQLVVFQDARDPRMAGEFIKHIIGRETGLYYFAETGLPPVTNEAIRSSVVAEDPWTSRWLDISSHGRSHELLQFENIRELQNILTEEFQAALIGSKSAERSISAAAARIQDAIQ